MVDDAGSTEDTLEDKAWELLRDLVLTGKVDVHAVFPSGRTLVELPGNPEGLVQRRRRLADQVLRRLRAGGIPVGRDVEDDARIADGLAAGLGYTLPEPRA